MGFLMTIKADTCRKDIPPEFVRAGSNDEPHFQPESLIFSRSRILVFAHPSIAGLTHMLIT